MSEALEFLQKNKVFYLATAAGDTPHIRPFGAVAQCGGKLWYCTSSQKNVYRQLAENPKVEIVSFDAEARQWLRISGAAVVEANSAAAEAIFTALPSLREFYSGRADFTTFYLKDVTAVIYSFDGSSQRQIAY